MNEDRIVIGDLVVVNFHNCAYTLCSGATVMHVPVATGNSWVFKAKDGTVHHVSEGCTVTRIRKST